LGWKGAPIKGISEGILAFVMARWQKSGGFGFAPTVPASVEDTYYALRILDAIKPVSEKELDALGQDSRLKDFLMRAEGKETWNIKTAYHHVFCCILQSVAPDESWLRKLFGSWQNQSHTLTHHYYASCLQDCVPQMDLTLGEDRPLSWRSSRELWMLLCLNGGIPEGFHAMKVDLVQWLQTCQNPDGGFGFVPASTSFIENSHWCLRALSLLRSQPLWPDLARDFVLRCRTARGGFARKNGGAPFLYATWHAVAGLAILSKMSTVPSPRTATSRATPSVQSRDQSL
jgi:hypothetical protein